MLIFPTLDEIISYIEEKKPRAWRDGHYPWQFLFEQIHGIDEYNGFYYDNPNIGQIYDRSQSDSEKRGSCLPASFEMAVEHLFLPLGRNELDSDYHAKSIQRSKIGKIRFKGTKNSLGELVIGGISYPINQPILHDMFRCDPARMMSVMNKSELGIKIASNLHIDPKYCRYEYRMIEKPYHRITQLDVSRLTLVESFIGAPANFNPMRFMIEMIKVDLLPSPVFTTRDNRTWNIVRSLLQGRTPILTYRFSRPQLNLKKSPFDDDFQICDEESMDVDDYTNNLDDFNPEQWPKMQGHAIVVIGLKKIDDELYFLINDPGPSAKIDIREGKFELLSPSDSMLKCGSRYWISERCLLEGRMSIDGLFEISRDYNVLNDSAEIHQVSEFRMGRKVKKKPIDSSRIVIL